MGALLFDTTVVIDLLRGVRGDEQEGARRLFAGLRNVPLGEREGWRAGEWRRDHAGRGTTLAQAGCLVAAAALSLGGRLGTGNPKDFPMSELTIEHWPAGE